MAGDPRGFGVWQLGRRGAHAALLFPCVSPCEKAALLDAGRGGQDPADEATDAAISATEADGAPLKVQFSKCVAGFGVCGERFCGVFRRDLCAACGRGWEICGLFAADAVIWCYGDLFLGGIFAELAMGDGGRSAGNGALCAV